MNKAVADIVTMLKALFDTFNVSDGNPLKGTFTADHTGLDAVLDSITVDINASTGQFSITDKNSGNILGTATTTTVGSTTPVRYVPFISQVTESFSAASGEYWISIAWKKLNGAKSYNLYWSTSAGVNKANGTKIANVTSEYRFTNFINGRKYYFVVTAVFDTGETAESNEVSITTGMHSDIIVIPSPPIPISSPTPPPVPTVAIPREPRITIGVGELINYVTKEHKIDIDWNPVSGALSYNLYWSTTAGANKRNGTKIANVTSPYNFTGFTNGTRYYFVVTGIFSFGEGQESNEISIIPQEPNWKQ